MRKFTHLLIFILAFQVEVRVRASEPLSVPENCMGKVFPCSFKVESDQWSYSAGKVKLHAGVGSILTETKKGQEWKLVEGQLWVENAPSVRIQTISSEVEASSGQYWVFAKKDRVVYRNISSKLVVTFKDQSRMEVPRGFEVWVGGVNSEAQVEHGMVQPVNLREHLKAWYELYPGTRRQFLSEVQDLKDQWADLVEQSGNIYKKVAERKLAALDEVKRQELQLKQQKELERRRVREQFYRKVFEN